MVPLGRRTYYSNQRDTGRKTAPWKMCSESFMIGKDDAEKADPGDARNRHRDDKPKRSFNMKSFIVEKSLKTTIKKTLQFSDCSSRL